MNGHQLLISLPEALSQHIDEKAVFVTQRCSQTGFHKHYKKRKLIRVSILSCSLNVYMISFISMCSIVSIVLVENKLNPITMAFLKGCQCFPIQPVHVTDRTPILKGITNKKCFAFLLSARI